MIGSLIIKKHLSPWPDVGEEQPGLTLATIPARKGLNFVLDYILVSAAVAACLVTDVHLKHGITYTFIGRI